MGGRRGPETEEAEKSNGGDQARPLPLTLHVHHDLLTIPKEAIATCQDSTQWLFQLYSG